jgi:hypothetical protein
MDEQLRKAAAAVLKRWGKGHLSWSVQELACALAEASNPDRFATPEEISEAQSEYTTDEINIDEGALASRGEGGLWVAAWVWLDRSDESEE